jgi:hypothetical protein
MRQRGTRVKTVRSPTVRRRELGVLLRALRIEEGLTVEQVAAGLLCSTTKVSSIETGNGAAKPRDVHDRDETYDGTSATG